MAEDYEITGKSKLVVDEGGYFNAKRKDTAFNELTPDIGVIYFDSTYFDTSGDVDKVRVVAGKNWDYQIIEKVPVFSNNWTEGLQFDSFDNEPIILETCGDAYESPFDDTGLTIDQEIMLKGYYTPKNTNQINADTAAELSAAASRYGAYIKTGYLGKPPIVNAGRYFYDHYHSTFDPFTPDELITKQPVGKAYFADYKTYYNERLDSTNYEKITGLHSMQNSLPNIYGFLRLVKNELLLEDEKFELTKILNYLNDWLYQNNSSDSNKTLTKSDVYNTLLQKYPLETLILLYGALSFYRTDQLNNDELTETLPSSNQLLEKIINFDFTKHDASALFEEYFDTFTKLSEFQEFRVPAGGPFKLNKISALERIMSRIIFSPDFIPIMKKVDQYKKYFPYYVDLQFTAKRLTSLGDLMEKLFLTRFLSFKMATFKNKALDFDPETKDWAQYTYGITDAWCPGASCEITKNFVEFSSEKIYPDLFGYNPESVSPHTLSLPSGKRTLDFIAVLEEFSDPNNIIDPHHDTDEYEGSDFFRDIRNYVTFVRDDFKNPINLINDDNTIFKMLCGTAFRFKMLDIYKLKRRDYIDILNGESSYSEDLFYRIEKWTKSSDPGSEWKIIQHIIIPNTSELDVARYVDTQLKYSTYATYKYNVYSIRVVFGNKYKYLWGKSTDNGFLENSLQEFEKANTLLKSYGPSAWYQAPHIGGPSDEVWDGLSTPNITWDEAECEMVQGDVDTWTVWYPTLGNENCGDAWLDPIDLQDGGPWYSEMGIDRRGSPWLPDTPYATNRECTSHTMAEEKIAALKKDFLDWESLVGEDGAPGDAPFVKKEIKQGDVLACEPPVLNLPQSFAGRYLYTAKFLVRTEPSIQIIEDKLFSTPEVLIMDKPPMPPDVNIIPYRAVNNKLKFLISGTTGRAKELPIIILDSDNQKFDLVKRGQLIASPLDSSPLEGQEIEFANDDPVNKFQIFRIRTEPTTYEDFELYQQINGGVFEEEILPNTKYYYTFRSIDLHEHISNPSPIYEVELIDEKGAVKPIIRLFSIEPPETKTFVKECQKYIYFKPSLRQLNFSEHEDVDSVFSSDEKRKKYKLRLTSKGSGKKLDINFSFAKVLDPNP